ncbi:hypothetical protein D3273_22910 [Lichenibacterium minor]|uniref:Uncharacterized protein n=1 Tax=Lichenibacterium minor TaxID=2316528 RepID=A0A4Q2U4F2_9HYPH|nr:hypothetical protein [Lichenibacterium minor]RYC29665.1 hypothetical protein D3273_22910 [Lichenibacterium minor]
MTMSALEVGMRADALVQIMRSDVPLEHARGLVNGTSDEDVKAIIEAFRRRGWVDDNLPVPDRGGRLLDWLAGLGDNP